MSICKCQNDIVSSTDLVFGVALHVRLFAYPAFGLPWRQNDQLLFTQKGDKSYLEFISDR